ncbi:MAG: hypothetical protein EOP45_10030 [Sphingobacteriaceae bacterium]|nr:MAG: hypothetical protein EOP45_10030 [Sphingobacteriaceae bacterium]
MSDTFPRYQFSISMLWKVFRTVNQMLVDRGVVVDEENTNIDSAAAFQTKFGKLISILFVIDTQSSTGTSDNRNAMAFVTSHPRIGVFFADPETILVDHVRKYQHHMVEQQIKHAILVTRNALSPQARKILNDSKLYIESFKENELVLNITRHILVT